MHLIKFFTYLESILLKNNNHTQYLGAKLWNSILKNIQALSYRCFMKKIYKSLNSKCAPNYFIGLIQSVIWLYMLKVTIFSAHSIEISYHVLPKNIFVSKL